VKGPLTSASAPTLIGVAIGAVLGAIAGALYGRTNEVANWVTAAATVSLTVFALVQLLQFESDRADARKERRHRLEALATMARRSCEAAIAEEGYYAGVREWAGAVGGRFDPLEAQILEIRTLAAGLGSAESEAATNAFAAFMAAAGRVNVLGSARADMIQSQIDQLRRDALDFFQHTAATLGRISPPTDDYPALPAGMAKAMKDYPRM
jgi:hypothetical protein